MTGMTVPKRGLYGWDHHEHIDTLTARYDLDELRRLEPLADDPEFRRGWRDAKAQNKADFMNWQMVEQMPEFRSELEQLLTQLPLGGSQYLKIIRNNKLRRAVAEFIPIDDVFIPFSATNFYTAERKTHRMYVTEQTFEERIDAASFPRSA